MKALYRRAQAYMNMADLDLAEFDIKKALEIDPNNRYITKFTVTLCPMHVSYLSVMVLKLVTLL